MRPGEYRKRKARLEAEHPRVQGSDWAKAWAELPAPPPPLRETMLATEETRDPFGAVQAALHVECSVKVVGSAWIIRCRRCEAGWMVQRPKRGLRCDLFAVWNVLHHVMGHLEGRQLP